MPEGASRTLDARPGEAPPAVRSRAGATIVAANLVTLAMALYLRWPVSSLLWPYWVQSVVIGFFARRRILALRRFSTEGFTVNDQPVLPTVETQRSTANFFALHYGGFHLAYAVFLLVMAPPAWRDLPWLAVALASFAYGHRRSFEEHVARDLAGTPNIGTLMFMPYARIVPMHLVIILGSVWLEKAAGGVLVGFVALKILGDLVMHHVEHRTFEKGGIRISVKR
jgi:uncharacterized protein DUF6498